MSGLSEKSMQVCDFTRSYLRWRLDTTQQEAITVSQKLPMTLNNVRMPIECRTVVTEEATGAREEIFLGASCKGEQVWVPAGVWHQPNPDMLMWASRDRFVVCKQWDKVDKGVMLYPPERGPQPEKQLEDPRAAFTDFSLAIAEERGRVIEEIGEIIDVLVSDRRMVACTEYRMHGYHVLLEYPVKTVNWSERERYYQVDTGPVLLPDLENTAVPLILGCRLAFVAHNCPEWAEFIVNVPTPLTEEIAVHHYSRSERIEGTINRMIVIE